MAAAKGGARSGSRPATPARNAKSAGRKGNGANGKDGSTKNGSAKDQAANKPADAARAAARRPAPAPARAKSGPDAARPVGSGPGGSGARKGTQVRNRPVAATQAAGATAPAPAEAGFEWPAAWLRWTTFVLALAGLGVSVYLTYAHYTESALAGCTETTGVVNCGKVTTSAQSVVFGIPVAVLGLAFYAFMVAIMSPWAWKARRREVGLLRVVSLVVGIGFVLYLVYAELFDIGSICLYCTSVHVITFLLFVLTGLAVAIWGLSPRPLERRPSR